MNYPSTPTNETATNNIATHQGNTCTTDLFDPEDVVLPAQASPGSPPDLRWADCGGSTVPGWQLGWAQVIGKRHPRFTEDAVAHRAIRLSPGGVVGSPQPLCMVVSDGVGGGSRGEVCSAALAAHCIGVPASLIDKPEDIAKWMALAEGQVQLKLREVSFSPGAATLAAAWLYPCNPTRPGQATVQDHVQGHILRIGDARVYSFDGQHLQALTQDQTYEHMGETPPEGASPDDPARMVGTGFASQLELLPVSLVPGHSLLLCSDGLHRGLNAQQIASLLAQGGNPQERAQRLAQAAREGGSDDDITVLLAQVEMGQRTDGHSPASSSANWLGRFKRVFS